MDTPQTVLRITLATALPHFLFGKLGMFSCSQIDDFKLNKSSLKVNSPSDLHFL